MTACTGESVRRAASRATGCRLTERLLACLLGFAGSAPWFAAHAWVYPEHRDIATLAVLDLDDQRRAEFDRLWADARAADGDTLCPSAADVAQGVAPPCIDWAALSGIAGDHACSGREMMDTVTETDWILVVADVAAQLKADLSRIPVTAPPRTEKGLAQAVTATRERLADSATRAERLNALRAADTRMQRADPKYATRADANLAHFMLPRPDTELDPTAYGMLALKPGTDLNAAGVYAWYHISALQKAARLAHEALPEDERRALARSILFDEAFALHFLEDTYAAGHVAGSWGDVSQRKGTHDFYNQHGMEVFTWKGRDRTVVLMGDAHMRPEDAELAAEAVRVSIEQILDAAVGRDPGFPLPYKPGVAGLPDDFDVCESLTFPDRGEYLGSGESRYAPALEEVLLATPVPGLGPGLGELPRARSEVGTFVGLAAALEGRGISGGFLESQDEAGAIGGLDLGARFGLGLEGALGDAGDGLVFFQLGYHADGPSSNEFVRELGGPVRGSLTSAIPAREAISTRLRMPFYLVPGDLLFLFPMYFVNPEGYNELAVTASNGGLLGLEKAWNTGVGRFQFVLGRELGVYWYGVRNEDQLFAPPTGSGEPSRLVNFKSMYYDLPILEYRPFRAFSSNQSSSLLFQLFAGLDVPYDEEVVHPRVGGIDLDSIWSLGLRMVFDWRYYW